MKLQFTAYGIPAPQGSVKSIPLKGGKGVRTVSKTNRLVEWREVVRYAAWQAAGPGWETQDGAAKVRMRFWIPRPKGRAKTVDVLPTRGEDLDKYIRAVNDSITNAGIWTDDSRVVHIEAGELYAVGPDLPKIWNPSFHMSRPCVEVWIEWLPNDASLLGS